jgi:hypothetical protein
MRTKIRRRVGQDLQDVIGANEMFGAALHHSLLGQAAPGRLHISHLARLPVVANQWTVCTLEVGQVKRERPRTRGYMAT